MLKSHIISFFSEVASGEIEIYNEFSFQHELGIHLRSRLPDFKVEFERNVTHFGFKKSDFIKKEIDISIIGRDSKKLEGVIELKYPRNGQVPETMFSFCKDISFLEQLQSAGFHEGLFVALADDPLFYSGQCRGIYDLFRGEGKIHGMIQKPTGKKDSSVNVNGCYNSHWCSVSQSTKYCLIETKTGENQHR
jgi:hypothetical protein